MSLGRAGWLGLIALLAAGQARAAELTVFAAGSVIEGLRSVGDDYVRATGQHVTFVGDPTAAILVRARAGQAFDVVAATQAGIDQLQKDGLVGPDAPRPLASAVLGVAIKAGAAKPDIGSVAAFKAALLKARSVSYPDPARGAAGAYVKSLFQTLGIADQMAAKTVLSPSSTEAAAALGDGRVDVVLAFVNEINHAPGLQIVGLFPDAVQSPAPHTIGLSAHAAYAAGARAFIAFATSHQEAARFEQAGAVPAN
jgi:molybdate transport system substrate-binding protein